MNTLALGTLATLFSSSSVLTAGVGAAGAQQTVPQARIG